MKKIQEMLNQIDDMDRPRLVRLGDASIASPFTSKLSSVVAGEGRYHKFILFLFEILTRHKLFIKKR